MERLNIFINSFGQYLKGSTGQYCTCIMSKMISFGIPDSDTVVKVIYVT